MSVKDLLQAALRDKYTFERELGRGGMATVWLAEDIRHRRRVAIKVVHAELSEVIGSERFLKEIELTANLQHPHILPLFESGEARGQLYYVMPYVAGETLRTRLEREGQLPIDDVVRIAREVASALDYAHRRSVIHRDIKPENILLLDGTALVADFGIALAVTNAAGERITQSGISVGTPHYMSPEQAAAERAVDGRSDQYALASVVYEALAGSPPFTGPSTPMIVHRLMTEDPAPLTSLRRSVPPSVAAAVHRALAKVPADRFATAGDFAAALENGTKEAVVGTGRYGAVTPAPSTPRWKQLATVATVAAVASFAAATLARRESSSRTESPLRRFSIVLPESAQLGLETPQPAVALSPDGTRLAYVGRRDGRSTIFVRDFATGAVTAPAGRADAESPFFSPDGKSLGFVDGWTVQRVSVDGGTPVRMLTVNPFLRGVTWREGGRLIAAPGLVARLFEAPDDPDSTRWPDLSGDAVAGPPAVPGQRVQGAVTITSYDSTFGERSHRFPAMLPDDRGVLFTALGQSALGDSRVMVRDFARGGTKVIMERAFGARYVSSGHLVFARDGALWAVPFDLGDLTPTGPAVKVIDSVVVHPGGAVHYAVADDGTLVYVRGAAWSAETQLVWVDRKGTVTTTPIALGEYRDLALSPDGRRVALALFRGGAAPDVWVGDLSSGALTQITRDPGSDGFVVWSPDGARLAFGSQHALLGPPKLHITRADGTGESTQLGDTAAGVGQTPTAWSRDGHTLMFTQYGRGATSPAGAQLADIVSIDPAQPEKWTTWAAGAFDQGEARVSSDGQWVAYTTNETGRGEIYVRPLRGEGRVGPISTNGGREPRWSSSGRELFYREGNRVMSVKVRVSPSFSASPPEALFTIDAGVAWDVAGDGTRFLMLRRPRSSQVGRIEVVQGWAEELRQRVRPGSAPTP